MTESVTGNTASRPRRNVTKPRGTVLGRLRRRMEAVLHPFRRRAANARLRNESRPGLVLFMCHGNVCRSPYAEAVFRREIGAVLSNAFDTTSAGFIGPDRPSPPEALAAAGRVGVDLTGHRSKLVTADIVRTSALVVVMSADQAAAIRGRFGASDPRVLVLGDLDPMSIDARTIRDPWNSPAEVFDESYARIDRCVRALVGVVTRAS